MMGKTVELCSNLLLAASSSNSLVHKTFLDLKETWLKNVFFKIKKQQNNKNNFKKVSIEKYPYDTQYVETFLSWKRTPSSSTSPAFDQSPPKQFSVFLFLFYYYYFLK